MFCCWMYTGKYVFVLRCVQVRMFCCWMYTGKYVFVLRFVQVRMFCCWMYTGKYVLFLDVYRWVCFVVECEQVSMFLFLDGYRWVCFCTLMCTGRYVLFFYVRKVIIWLYYTFLSFCHCHFNKVMLFFKKSQVVVIPVAWQSVLLVHLY